MVGNPVICLDIEEKSNFYHLDTIQVMDIRERIYCSVRTSGQAQSGRSWHKVDGHISRGDYSGLSQNGRPL